MRICSVVGARPQFIKASIVGAAADAAGISEDLVHTGQHYDAAMSEVFFREMGIPEPVVNLEVGSSSHAVQTGQIMERLESFLLDRAPYDVVLVYGDTNSTIAAALVAAKLHIPVAHVEAGLRSHNRRMPEEINRIVTDRLSSLLFCPSRTAVDHLAAEGVTNGVSITGDVMYDALRRYLPIARQSCAQEDLVPFGAGSYYLATLHRAENTDDIDRLRRAIALLTGLEAPVVWPVHPRTEGRMRSEGIDLEEQVYRCKPFSYLQMLSVLEGAKAVLTDSGGLQKEAYWMKRPCVTLRTETEWVETCEGGWNVVADLDSNIVHEALARPPMAAQGFPYGRGDAGVVIAQKLLDYSSEGSSIPE